MRNWYSIRAQAGGVPEISIYDEIGGWGVTAWMFNEEFKAKTRGATEATLLINSPGGNVVEAITICNLLMHSGLRITGKVMGVAASAASLLLCACANVQMPANTFQFLHDPINRNGGDAEEHREIADMLDQIRKPMLAMYVAKTGLDEAKLLELFGADSLLDAEQCKALGLCDELLPATPVSAKFEVDRLPAQVQALLKTAPPPPPAPATPFAHQVKARAEAAGVGEFAAVWALDPEIGSVEALDAAIEAALDVRAVCEVVGKADRAPAFIRARVPIADARRQLSEALAEEDAAATVNTARTSKDVLGSKAPAHVDSDDVWAKYNAQRSK